MAIKHCGAFGSLSLCVMVVIAVEAAVARTATAAEPISGYAAVQRAFLREDFNQVIGLAQAFILQNPEKLEVPRVWLWMVLSLDKLQQSSEALRELNRLKDRLAPRDPLWPELLYWEGDISRRALQMVRARSTFQRLLQLYPDSSWAVQAQLGLGLIDLHQQAFESAIASFHQVAQQQPDSPVARDARLFEGLCHLQLKHFTEAVALFEPLLEEIKEPVNIAQAAFYLGESLSELGRYDEAVVAYHRAADTKEAPQWSRPALFGLGWASYRAGHCTESIDVFERYLTQSVGDHRTEAMFAEGSCLLKEGRDNEALSVFERIVASDPNHVLAVESGLILVDAYRRQGRPALAKDLLAALLHRRLEPALRGQVQLRLGSLALEEGDTAQATTLFTLAEQTGDPVVRQAALSGLGDTQLFLGDATEAGKRYEEATQIAKDAAVAAYATYQLGRIALQLGTFDEAAKLFRALSTSTQANIAEDARLALALTYLRMGETPLARSTLEEVRRQYPDQVASARAGYYLAIMAVNNGDDAEARDLCEEAIARAPKTEEAVDARLLLADLMARRASVAEAVQWLRASYSSPGLSRRHRAKLAKRLGDLARGERAYAEAILWYEEAGALLPTLKAESVYRIASCYEEAGDVELAMRWYQHLDQAPWRVRGQLALAKLLERDGREADAKAIYQSLAREPIPEAKIAEERLAAMREGSH